MLEIATKEYKDALQNALTERQRFILKKLMEMPGSTATAEELSGALRYKSFTGANLQIGNIGKRIADHLNLTLPQYRYNSQTNRDRFYLVIGPYDSNGWKMHKNLKAALKLVD